MRNPHYADNKLGNVHCEFNLGPETQVLALFNYLSLTIKEFYLLTKNHFELNFSNTYNMFFISTIFSTHKMRYTVNDKQVSMEDDANSNTINKVPKNFEDILETLGRWCLHG